MNRAATLAVLAATMMVGDAPVFGGSSGRPRKTRDERAAERAARLSDPAVQARIAAAREKRARRAAKREVEL